MADIDDESKSSSLAVADNSDLHLTEHSPPASLLEKWLTAPDEGFTAAFQEAAGTVLDRLLEHPERLLLVRVH
ncbi:hypothetical protein BC826DRAFT_1108559 [Russula brevipes]|nr:hypothetical protein BC826DRAFT_1108559 [Russula brevipes]